MAYEIQAINPPSPRGHQFKIVDPHQTFPIVWDYYHNSEDAEKALSSLKRDDSISESFDAWVHAEAEEQGVSRSTVVDAIDVTQFR